MRNEDKFNRDIQNITEKKKKKNRMPDQDKLVPSFRPKLVADYRHQSSTSTRVDESSLSRGDPGQREPSVISISSGSEESGDVEVVSATSHSSITSRGSGSRSSGGHYKSSNRPSSTRAGSGAGLEFSVLSYNILADVLQRRHPELYTSCRAEDLDWAARWAAIKAQIAGLGWPDVVCLQEVQVRRPDHAATQILPFLASHGYTVVVKPKTGDKDDGCLTAFRKDKFELEEECPVEYKVDRVPVLDRDNVGLILKLAPKMGGATPRPLLVANTHLLYNPKRGDIRLCQAAMLLAELDRLGPGRDTPVILAGDLNSQPDSPVVQLLTAGQLSYSGQKLGRRARRPAPHKLLPDSLGLSDSCQWLVALQQRGEADSGLATNTGGFWHGLELASAFPADRVTTHQDGWTMVDYILYSASPRAKLRLASTQQLPCAQDMRQEGSFHSERIPNQKCPSDHLPLLANFRLLP